MFGCEYESHMTGTKYGERKCEGQVVGGEKV